jgi:hypothetical protein
MQINLTIEGINVNIINSELNSLFYKSHTVYINKKTVSR